MITAINNFVPPLISLGLLGVLLVFALRMIIRKQKLDYLSSFVWMMLITLFAFFAMNLAYTFSLFRHLIFFQVENALLLGFQFSYLALAIFIYLDAPNAKKGKILLRLPIIGLLLGYYLSSVESIAAFAIVEVGISILLAKKAKERNYAWRAQLKALPPIPLLAMYSLPINTWFAIYLAWSLHFKFGLANAALVKKMMVDYDETSNE
ncbi:MAG: hypothetical protein KC478_13815 [Bacteriovoracaceae bacterium]|nr:hypothetical protein [Bacteriovoracaceae bacterium]